METETAVEGKRMYFWILQKLLDWAVCTRSILKRKQPSNTQTIVEMVRGKSKQLIEDNKQCNTPYSISALPVAMKVTKVPL